VKFCCRSSTATVKVGSKLLLDPASSASDGAASASELRVLLAPAEIRRLCETCVGVFFGGITDTSNGMLVACPAHALRGHARRHYRAGPSSCTATFGDAGIPSDVAARPAGLVFDGIADTSELRAIGILFLRPFVDSRGHPHREPSSCTSSCTATPGELASLRTSLRDWPLGGVLFGGIMDTSVLRAKGMFCTWASQER
jgi:hypothetical protein